MDTFPPLPQQQRPTFRLSFGTVFLIFILILALGGGTLSLLFLREMKDVVQDFAKNQTVGACSAHTRSLQTEQLILSRIDFAYPCGWHAVERALVRDSARRGIVSDYLYINPDPISFAPRDVEPSRIVLRIDEQDQPHTIPRMRSLQQYVTAEQKEFMKQTTTTLVPNAGSITFTKIDGVQDIFGYEVPVVVYYTELYDKQQPTRRAVLRVWSGNPKSEDGTVEKALEHIIETLRQI